MPGTDLDVARIGVDVVDQQRRLSGDGGADQALAELQPHRFVAVRIADRVGDRQFAAALVEQIDRERVELDEPGDELGNLREQFVEIEHGRDLAAQVEQRREHLLLARRRRRGCVRSFVGGGSVRHS